MRRAAVLALAACLPLAGAACAGPADRRADRIDAYRPRAAPPPASFLSRWTGSGWAPLGTPPAPDPRLGGPVTALVRDDPLLGGRAAQRAAMDRVASGLAAGPRHPTVLGYSSRPRDARAAARTADLDAQRLAAGLAAVLGPDASLDLVGAGVGARVAAVAARSLPVPPLGLTLLDAPENEDAVRAGLGTNIAGVLDDLPVGAGPGNVRVANLVGGLHGRAAPARTGASPRLAGRPLRGEVLRGPDGPNAPLGGVVLAGPERGARVLEIRTTRQPGDAYLEFDWRVLAAPSGARVTAWVDGRLRWEADASLARGKGSSASVGIGDLDVGPHVVTLAIATRDPERVRVAVGRLRVLGTASAEGGGSSTGVSDDTRLGLLVLLAGALVALVIGRDRPATRPSGAPASR